MKVPEHAKPLCFIRLPARMESLPMFMGPVIAAAEALGMGQERRYDLELALEEVLVNIFSYAYPDQAGSVTLTCRMVDGRLITLIEDEGIAFSVTAAGPPDLSLDMADRKIGGLGIHLVRTLMDDVRYLRDGNRNLLELVLRIQPEEG